MKGGRKLSSWNIFVKKIYQEGHSKNKNYSFKQALSDASKRKSEMGSVSSSNTAMGTKKSKKAKKGSKKAKKAKKSHKKSHKKGGTRKHRKH